MARRVLLALPLGLAGPASLAAGELPLGLQLASGKH